MGRNLGPLNIKDSYEGLVQISGSDQLTDGSGSLISSLDIAASTATSASFATTASYALNVTPIDTGSLLITGSATDATLTFTKGDGSTFDLTVNNVENATSASYATTASFALNVSTPTLQEVTDAGNTTTDGISISALVITGSSNQIVIYDNSDLSKRINLSWEENNNSFEIDSSLSGTPVTGATFVIDETTFSKTTLSSLEATNITASNASFTSASIGYLQTITGSAKIIGDAFIILNNNTPTERYAGLVVQDSGSTANTASLLFDGQTNDWFYQYTDDGGATDEYGAVMFGPGYNTQGAHVYPSNNTILKGTGDHHIVDSSITDDGTLVTINANVSASGYVSASSFIGDGSQLTGISTDPFPYTGSADVSGSVVVDGLLQSGNSNNSATGTNTAVIGGNNNTANGDKSVVIGGQNNAANNTCYVFGGENHLANGANATVVGGTDNYITNGSGDSIFGGWGNDTIGGGVFNQTIVAGNTNVIQGAGGYRNILSLGGQFNEMRGGLSNSVIIGGLRNDMGAPSGNNGLSRNSTIIGGQSNKMGEGTTTAGYNTDNCSIINNTGSIIDSGSFQAMFNGALNIISGSTMATIIGSQNSKISGYSNSVIIGGDGIIADADDTVFVPNLSIYGDTFISSSALGTDSLIDNLGQEAIVTGSQVQHIVNLSQAEYDALTPDANTLYVIDGAETLGDTVISGSLIGEVGVLTDAAGTTTLDCSLGNYFTLAMPAGGTTALTPTNITAGQTINIKITQNATASTLTYAASIDFPGGTAFTISTGAGEVDVLTLVSFDGTSLQATGLANFS